MSSAWYSDSVHIDSIAIDDRGLHYGDGLFETIAIRQQEPRLWGYHIERLQKGAAALGLDVPTEDQLAEQLTSAIRQSRKQDATAKLVVTAGSGQRGYARSAATRPNVLIGVFDARTLPDQAYQEGIRIRLCETRLATGSAFAGLKTLNRLEQVAARSELDSNTEFEGLTMDANGHIICGTMSNVFFVLNNRITTPPLVDCGVAGVMRRHILTLAETYEMAIDETHITAEDLSHVDEIFVSNSQFGIVPVAACDKLNFEPGPKTRQIMHMLAESGIAECRV